MNTHIIKPILAVTWLLLATSSLQAGQGGGTAGGNAPEDTAPASPDSTLPVSPDERGALNKQVHTDRVAESDSIIITWSENNDELRGYSSSRGGWETLGIEKQNAVVPIVGSDVAAIRIGNSIAAFGGRNSWWDVIQLSNDSVAVPTVSNDLVQIEDNGHLYTFSAAMSRWTSPTDSELQEATSELRLYGWKRHHRQRLDEWLNSLPLYKARGIAISFPSGRTTLASIHTARRSWLKEVEDKLNELVAQPEPKTSSEPVANLSSRPYDAHRPRIAGLREELLRLDGDVNAVANDADLDGTTREARKQALRKLVTKMFDLRKLLQLAEVQHMRIKLELIEANIYARSGSQNREDIIEHRVNELLDSNGTRPGRGAGDKPTPTTNLGTPAAGTPIGVPSPPQLPLGGPAVLKSHPVRNIDAGIPWPQPAEIVKDLRSKKQDVTSNLNSKVQQQEEVEQWSRRLEQLQSEGIADQEMTEATRQKLVDMKSMIFRSTQSKTDILQRDWRNAWSTYQSRLRLLRLDVDEARLALESLAAKCNQWRQLADRGAVTASEVQEAESNLAVAKINLARSEEMLQLYADIESTEPELNPASLDAADSTKPDSSPKPVSDVQDPLLPNAPDDPLAPQQKAVRP